MQHHQLPTRSTIPVLKRNPRSKFAPFDLSKPRSNIFEVCYTNRQRRVDRDVKTAPSGHREPCGFEGSCVLVGHRVGLFPRWQIINGHFLKLGIKVSLRDLLSTKSQMTARAPATRRVHDPLCTSCKSKCVSTPILVHVSQGAPPPATSISHHSVSRIAPTALPQTRATAPLQSTGQLGG